jgi:hypothetical protein
LTRVDAFHSEKRLNGKLTLTLSRRSPEYGVKARVIETRGAGESEQEEAILPWRVRGVSVRWVDLFPAALLEVFAWVEKNQARC